MTDVSSLEPTIFKHALSCLVLALVVALEDARSLEDDFTARIRLVR